MTEQPKHTLELHIEGLIGKAARSEKPDDAMKFSQAALNAANALCSIRAWQNNVT